MDKSSSKQLEKTYITFGPKLDRPIKVDLEGPKMPLGDLKSHTKEL